LNDSYGHPFGDRVLEGLGELLHTLLRTTDAPCRYGGEEFGLILSETNEAGALISAERLRQRLAECPFRPGDRHVRVTASLGIACSALFEPKELTVSRLIAVADDALYRAKAEGRNRVCVGRRSPNVID
jgi:diguanylate cyclase (GGDEF)-like protein